MTLGSHQRTVGKSQVAITPRLFIEATTPDGLYDTDPCANDPRPWDCALRNITEAENSLTMDWRAFGRIWMNPPFDTRFIAEWFRRMAEHNFGTTLTHARTDTAWFDFIWRGAAAVLFVRGRVTFHQPNGDLIRIQNPLSKAFDKPANSGAPVVLAAFGQYDADVLAECGIEGQFVPLIFQRFTFGAAVEDPSWRDLVRECLAEWGGPLSVADLYRAVADHAKTKGNPNWKAKLRQTLQRGRGKDFQHVGPDQWASA